MVRQFSQDDAVLNTRSLVTARDRQYSDFNLLFRPRSSDGDIFLVTDAGAVLQSVKSLILTNSFERPFRSNIGGNLGDFVFELNDSFTRFEIEDAIRRTIDNYEPRARVTSVKITSIGDQSVDILVELRIVQTQEIVRLSLAVERIR